MVAVLRSSERDYLSGAYILLRRAVTRRPEGEPTRRLIHPMESRLFVQAFESDDPHHLPQQNRHLGTQNRQRHHGEPVPALVWGSLQ